MLLSALGYGIPAGYRIQKNRRINSALTEIEKLGPKGAELRGQIKAVLAEDTPTFEDYYLRSLKLEKILDRYDEQEQHVHTLLNALLADTSD